MVRKLTLFVLLFALLGTCAVADASLRIAPEMELLAGVLSQTSWIEDRGPTGSGNEYFRALKEFFSEYKGHQAIAIAQELTKKGFSYDAPPAFICHLGPLPELEVVYEYSDYILRRAGGRDLLESFRIALADLAAEMDFMAFYREWEPYLEASLAPCYEGFRPERIEKWLADFFGWIPSGFQIIMAPSMFPAGGYGASVTDADGNSVAIQIVREYGRSQTTPEFPEGTTLESLTIHELGHSFVNPSLEAYPGRARNLRPLLSPVQKVMRDQAYSNVTIFLNEQVLRAVEVIAARDLFSPEVEALILENNEKNGFYLTRYVVQQLEYYQANRDLYPLFTDFVPYLYDQLDAYQKEHSTWRDRFLGRFMR